jgi:putative hydrolase of the HAD superfamily
MRYPFLLFDLFGTVVHFSSRVPSVQVAGETRRSTMYWLEAEVGRELPDVRFDDFLSAIGRVTEEIVRGRAPEFLEVPSQQRFARALERLGVTGPGADETAGRLSQAHMAHLAKQTHTPAEHAMLLRELAGDHILGLVSNFDHGATARAILRRDGIEDLFRVVLISDGFGRRKPHPAIFVEGLRLLGASADRSLYVGDTLEDDVGGARRAGLDVAWIDTKGTLPVPDDLHPTHTLRRLVDLPHVLGRRQA